MDYNQDCAFNRIQILDETVANSDKAGCAIFNGGINVNKNIYTKEINADYIEVKKIKVFDSIGIQNDIKIEGSIYPIDNISKSSLGSISNKWNKLFLIDGNIQTINSHNINTKNIKIENQKLVASIIDIPNTYQFNSNFTIDLDYSIIYINVNIEPDRFDYKFDNCIIIVLPCSNINYEYHKIVLTQKYNYRVKWLIPGNESFISCNNNQIYEILNIDDDWRLTKYNENNHIFDNQNQNNHIFDHYSNNIDCSNNISCSNNYFDDFDNDFNNDFLNNCSNHFLDDFSDEFDCSNNHFNNDCSNNDCSNNDCSNNDCSNNDCSNNNFNNDCSNNNNFNNDFNNDCSNNNFNNYFDSSNNFNNKFINFVILQNKKLNQKIESINNNTINLLTNDIECIKEYNNHKFSNLDEIIDVFTNEINILKKKQNDKKNSMDEIIKLLTNEITKLKHKNEDSSEKICKLEEKLSKTDHKLKKILKYLKIE
jgi:hypothetical protein